jgi:hypothetical protein
VFDPTAAQIALHLSYRTAQQLMNNQPIHVGCLLEQQLVHGCCANHAFAFELYQELSSVRKQQLLPTSCKYRHRRTNQAVVDAIMHARYQADGCWGLVLCTHGFESTGPSDFLQSASGARYAPKELYLDAV